MGIPLEDTTDDEAEDKLENAHNRENERVEKGKRMNIRRKGLCKGPNPPNTKRK